MEGDIDMDSQEGFPPTAGAMKTANLVKPDIYKYFFNYFLGKL
jgi:hypothetical protein